MMIVLSEGIYAVDEPTLLKPERRSFSKTERLTIRDEVLPDDPDWNTGRMPFRIFADRGRWRIFRRMESERLAAKRIIGS